MQSEGPVTSHRQSLASILTERGWRRTNDCVTHTCGCYSQSQRTRSARRGLISDPDVCQLFGLVGAPTLILLDSSGQQENKLIITIFGFISLMCVVAQEIMTYPPFGSWFAVHMVISIYDYSYPRLYLVILVLQYQTVIVSQSSLTSCKSFVLFRLHIMARPLQLSKRLKFSYISTARLFSSERISLPCFELHRL